MNTYHVWSTGWGGAGRRFKPRTAATAMDAVAMAMRHGPLHEDSKRTIRRDRGHSDGAHGFDYARQCRIHAERTIPGLGAE